MSVCYICNREDTSVHPVMTCTDCSQLCCICHCLEIDGDDYCSVCGLADLATKLDAVEAFAADRVSSPVSLTTFDEVMAEVLAIWTEMEKMTKEVKTLRDEVDRVKMNAGVY